ncbi:MAG TPA: hypothetical protein PKX92_05415 [Edaphocola sp.]|nr:hypothetical protein [Edaphocola sp.]
MKGNVFIILILALSFGSCVKDKPISNNSRPAINEHPKMFIANEGAYGNGNASLSYLDLSTNEIFNNIYASQNEGKALGDVFQSIKGDRNNLYLIINNSNCIVVIDKRNFKQKFIIPIEQPRQMAFLNDTLALVSSMYRKKLYVVNLSSGNIDKTIELPYANTEGLLNAENKIFICPWDVNCSYVYVFDINSQNISDSIFIGKNAPGYLALDKDKNLWVTSGNPTKGVAAAITKLNPKTKQILQSFSFNGNTEIIKPCLNPSKDTIYFLAVNYNATNNDYNGLYRMNIEANTAPSEAFVKSKALQYFWSVGINPYNGNIYLGDPRGWIQSGQVIEFSPSGQEINRFNVGIGPGDFYFD